MQVIFAVAACASVLAVALICIFLFANGIPAMSKIGFGKFLTGELWRPKNDIYGIFPMIVGSLYVTAGAIIIGVPIGILTAVFMAFYCPKAIYRPLKMATELLAGIPSVVYGFFGLVVLVPWVREIGRSLHRGGNGSSMITASILLGMMILPTIIGLTESALRAVPTQYYEGAVALGGTHERAILTFAVLIFLIVYVVVHGVPYLKPSIFSLHYTSENASLMPALINTVIMTFLSLLIAVPFGIFSAIFLVEYAKRGNKFVEVIRLTTETLQGIPSIVYGLFGMLFFVTTCGWGFSILAGAFTLAIMVLPLIMRSTEEALKAVPDSYREGSFGLGAGKLRTVFRIVLPSAVPGILAGVILAIGRIVGETAALIYTAGTVAKVPSSVFGSGRTLAVHMYNLSSEGLYMNQAYATAVVLLVLVVLINTISGMIAKRITKS